MKDNEIILVAGRAKDEREFATNISEALNTKFKIESIESVGEKSEIDNKERFVAFIASKDAKEFDYQLITTNVQSLGYGVRQFNDMDDAIIYAGEHYNFQDQETLEQEANMEELEKEFPPFSAEEIEQFLIFDSLYRTNRLYPMRGKFRDELITVLSNVVYGNDQIRVTPFAVMLTDEMIENIQLPYMEESD